MGQIALEEGQIKAGRNLVEELSGSAPAAKSSNSGEALNGCSGALWASRGNSPATITRMGPAPGPATTLVSVDQEARIW
jgi:hypothetical protein